MSIIQKYLYGDVICFLAFRWCQHLLRGLWISIWWTLFVIFPLFFWFLRKCIILHERLVQKIKINWLRLYTIFGYCLIPVSFLYEPFEFFVFTLAVYFFYGLFYMGSCNTSGWRGYKGMYRHFFKLVCKICNKCIPELFLICRLIFIVLRFIHSKL